jgi:hypothetical protein
MTNWNPEDNDIFRNGPDHRLNACVGDNGGPYDFLHFGRGYLASVEALCEHVEGEHSYIDAKIYPAVFLFRHGVELYLKGLLEHIPSLSGDPPIAGRGHSIQSLWSTLKPFLERHEVQFNDGQDLIQTMNSAISSIEIIDRNAEVFRYPNPNGHGTDLTGRYSHINFGRLKEFAHEIFMIFEAWLLVHDQIQRQAPPPESAPNN